MARPTKYEDARAKKITDLLRAGSTRKAAYQSAGINQDTFLAWIAKYSDFSDSVTRAEADAENIMATCLQKAAVTEGDWRAAESWLKRRRREEWGDHATVDLDNRIAELMETLAGGGQAQTAGEA